MHIGNKTNLEHSIVEIMNKKIEIVLDNLDHERNPVIRILILKNSAVKVIKWNIDRKRDAQQCNTQKYFLAAEGQY